ncbi:unnamed protein product, partial [Trichogramma brassicae]
EKVCVLSCGRVAKYEFEEKELEKSWRSAARSRARSPPVIDQCVRENIPFRVVIHRLRVRVLHQCTFLEPRGSDKCFYCSVTFIFSYETGITRALTFHFSIFKRAVAQFSLASEAAAAAAVAAAALTLDHSLCVCTYTWLCLYLCHYGKIIMESNRSSKGGLWLYIPSAWQTYRGSFTNNDCTSNLAFVSTNLTKSSASEESIIIIRVYRTCSTARMLPTCCSSACSLTLTRVHEHVAHEHVWPTHGRCRNNYKKKIARVLASPHLRASSIPVNHYLERQSKIQKKSDCHAYKYAKILIIYLFIIRILRISYKELIKLIGCNEENKRYKVEKNYEFDKIGNSNELGADLWQKTSKSSTENKNVLISINSFFSKSGVHGFASIFQFVRCCADGVWRGSSSAINPHPVARPTSEEAEEEAHIVASLRCPLEYIILSSCNMIGLWKCLIFSLIAVHMVIPGVSLTTGNEFSRGLRKREIVQKYISDATSAGFLIYSKDAAARANEKHLFKVPESSRKYRKTIALTLCNSELGERVESVRLFVYGKPRGARAESPKCASRRCPSMCGTRKIRKLRRSRASSNYRLVDSAKRNEHGRSKVSRPQCREPKGRRCAHIYKAALVRNIYNQSSKNVYIHKANIPGHFG